MPEIGLTISHCRIIEKPAAGGIGVAYRAEDTNLNRQVAIKVLPEMFSVNPERMARFEREPRLLAPLNLLDLAAIYGLEESAGTDFLVLELVEGETLADRIGTGPIPVDKSLRLALQIAQVLQAAHEKGVIHRDLKPSNIKLTAKGKVTALDFVLAIYKVLAKEAAHEKQDYLAHCLHNGRSCVNGRKRQR